MTVFSQTDTNSQPTKCFPIPLVKQITKDLLSGDSAKAQLKLTELQLTETENKVLMKDTIISLLRIKENNYQTIIEAQNQKYSILEDHLKKVEIKLKKEKFKNKFTIIVSSVLMATLVIITR